MPERPPRVTLGNLDTNGYLMAQYNPTKISSEIEVVWQKLTVPGLSHQPQQYVHTGNMQLKFDFGFDSESNEEYDQVRARRFLEALCFPVRSATSVANSAPPGILLGWPNLYRITANMHKLSIEDKLFGPTMQPTWFVATLTIEQALIERLYSDDVERMGPTWQV